MDLSDSILRISMITSLNCSLSHSIAPPATHPVPDRFPIRSTVYPLSSICQVLCKPMFKLSVIRSSLRKRPLPDGCHRRVLFRYPVVMFPAGSYHSASFGQFLTHSMQRMHSVPFFRLLELSVTSTSIGQTRLHFPQEIHLFLSHVTRNREK